MPPLRSGVSWNTLLIGKNEMQGPVAIPVWTERGSPAYRRISIALFLAGFATFSLLYCVQPLLSEFAADFQVSAAESSLALSLSTVFLAVSIVCSGAVSESLGRRRLMFVSLCAASALTVIAALMPGWHSLLIARALVGVALGGVPAVAMAYLAEEIHPKGLGYAMGLYVGGTAFGGMIGRIGTGVLTEVVSWRFALGSFGVLNLAVAVGFVLLLPASRNFIRFSGLGFRHHLSAWNGHLRHKGLPFLFLTGFLAMGAFVTVYNYLGFRLSAPPYELNQMEIGLIFTVYLFGIVASPTAGALADRFGRSPVLIGGVLFSITGIALTILPSLFAIIGGIACLTIGFFVSHSVASAWVGRMATTAKGHASSLYLLAYYIGSSVMGSAGGWFWTHGGWTAVAVFTGTMPVILLAAALHLHRLARQQVK